jgi:hypothetical protein
MVIRMKKGSLLVYPKMWVWMTTHHTWMHAERYSMRRPFGISKGSLLMPRIASWLSLCPKAKVESQLEMWTSKEKNTFICCALKHCKCNVERHFSVFKDTGSPGWFYVFICPSSDRCPRTVHRVFKKNYSSYFLLFSQYPRCGYWIFSLQVIYIFYNTMTTFQYLRVFSPALRYRKHV